MAIHSALFPLIITTFIYPVYAVSMAFQTNVYDEYVILGNTGVFKCYFPNFLRDHVKVSAWLQDDGRVFEDKTIPKPGSRIFSLDGNLFIIGVTRQDSFRSYRCQVLNMITNEVHISSTSGKLIITDPNGSVQPSITNTQRTVKSITGSSISLPCVAHGYPVPNYRWFKRNQGTSLVDLGDTLVSTSFLTLSSEIPSKHRSTINSNNNNKNRFNLVAGTGVLIIINVTQNDSGKYVCVANNSAGEDRVIFDLVVKQPLSVVLEANGGGSSNSLNIERLEPGVHITGSTGYRVEPGSQVRLNCKVTGYPIHSIIWSRDGRSLNTTNVGRVKLNSSLRVLTIYKVERSDIGCYSCRAQGDSNESAIGTRCLSLSEDAPKLKEVFKETVLSIGDRLSVKCVASGNPLPTVTWTLDGQPIPETHRIQYGDYVSMSGDVVSYVNITSLRLEDGGLYQCDAHNDAGVAHHSQMIYLKGKPYIRPMVNLTALAGQRITIRCPVSSYPVTRITWFKDNRELSPNERSRVLKNGTLMIKEARRDLDEGYYVCEASNNQGESDQKSFYIQVLRKPSISSFSFPASLTEGMRVIITCNVLTGDPPISVQWLKDNVTINRDLMSEVEVTEVTDLGSSLVFRDIRQKHAGQYTCLATNQVGQDSFTAQMTVKVPPKWVIEPIDQSAVVGDRITFDCQADGFPMPIIRWKISTEGKNDFKSVSSNYHIQTLENGSLTVKETDEHDSAYYLCEAENGVGPILSKIVRLSVHIQAHFKSTFQVIRVKKGEKLNVTCESHGEKPINIKWLKERTEIDLSNNRRYSVRESETLTGLVSSLLTGNATRSDSGSYLCVTWNPFGQSEMTSRVLVEESPDPPSDLVAAEFGSKSISLRYSLPYSGNSPVTKYIVQWKKDGDSWSSASTTEIDGSSNQVLLNDLKPLTSYDIRMFAANVIGKSEPSKVITITTDEEAPTTSPVSVRAEALSSTSISVKWKAPKHLESFGSVTGYYIGYKELHSEKPLIFKTVENKSGSKLSIIIGNLRKSTSYLFTVQAFNTKGAGPQSPEVIAKTLEKDPPATPKIRITLITATTATISWSIPLDSEPPSGYKVFIRQSSSDFKSHETLTEGKAISHSIKSLRCGTKYTVYLVSYNEIGESEPSEALSFQTEGGAPIAPDKSSLLLINSTFILLQLSAWRTTSCPINNFIVQYKEQGNSEWVLVSNTVSPVLDSFLVSGLHPATWYNLLIAAQSDAGSTEAEYFFATLTEQGGTIAPMSVSSNPEEHRLRRYVQMVLPITSVFISILVVVVFILFFGFRKNRNISNVTNINDQLSPKADNISMSSTKVVYETVQRDERTSVYCPSPYATTRVSLYFQDNPLRSQGNEAAHPENSYDMPLLKTNATNRALYDYQGGTSSCENSNLLDINHEPIFSR